MKPILFLVAAVFVAFAGAGQSAFALETQEELQARLNRELPAVDQAYKLAGEEQMKLTAEYGRALDDTPRGELKEVQKAYEKKSAAVQRKVQKAQEAKLAVMYTGEEAKFMAEVREAQKRLAKYNRAIDEAENAVEKHFDIYQEAQENRYRGQTEELAQLRKNWKKAEARLEAAKAEKKAAFAFNVDELLRDLERYDRYMLNIRSFGKLGVEEVTNAQGANLWRNHMNAAKALLKSENKAALVAGKIKGRGKLGIAGAAITVGAIAVEAASGDGAEASELKPADLENHKQAEEHSDVSIGELDAE